MARISLSYETERSLAVLTVGDDCEPRNWSAVRRLFEERSSATQVWGNKIALPWWEFISHRDALKFVLRSEGLGLVVSQDAGALLRNAVDRAVSFQDASVRDARQIDETDIQTELAAVGFERVLLPYQVRNVSLLTRHSAGATFSVPGGGKTSEALAFYYLTREGDEKLIIVAPNNAFVAWDDELPACIPGFDKGIARLTGGANRVADILAENPDAAIISYHQLPYVMEPLYAYFSRNSVCMMVDESHRMKRGDDGVHGSCILNLSFLPRRKLILSGTPMPNSATDLVSQFRFLFPEVRTTADTVIGDFQPFFVRTTKGELGLPPVERVRVDVEMSMTQRRLYEALASNAARHIAGLNARDRLRFRSVSHCVQYMLQAASNPGLLANSAIGEHELLTGALAEGISPKMREACRIAREWVGEGKKVLIWSGFVKTVEHLAGLLTDVGAEYIHGGIGTDDDDENLESREAVIRRFNDLDSSCRVLVANPAACSEGISLHHVCHNALYVDRNYNAAQYLQSEDRIHRIGLAEDIKTYIAILMSPGTIDESVARRLEGKATRMGVALNDPNLNINPIPVDELADGIDADDLEDLKALLGVQT